jgi:hypothetical protein
MSAVMLILSGIRSVCRTILCKAKRTGVRIVALRKETDCVPVETGRPATQTAGAVRLYSDSRSQLPKYVPPTARNGVKSRLPK